MQCCENDKLLTVVVPSYNASKYLDFNLQSFLRPSVPERLEVIVVDDGSTDDTARIADAYHEKYPDTIKVIHKENGGAGQARNVALEQIRGELVGLVDSDDFLERHMYEHLYSLMREDVDIAECAIGLTERDDFPMDDGSTAQIQVFPVVETMHFSAVNC